MSVELALICVAIAVVGAAVQGAIGLGFGLLSAPFLALIDTDFIPGRCSWRCSRCRRRWPSAAYADVDRRSAALAIAGRVPGVVAGAARRRGGEQPGPVDRPGRGRVDRRGDVDLAPGGADHAER